MQKIWKSIKTNFLIKTIPKNLWFFNIGGNDTSSFQEKHEFELVVAKNKLEVKNLVKFE